MKTFSLLLAVVSFLNIQSSQELFAEEKVQSYVILHRAEHFTLYRTDLKVAESISQIENLNMDFRSVKVDEQARELVFEGFEIPLPEGVSEQDFARLMDWNWRRVSDAWRLEEVSEVELKDLSELSAEEVFFDLEKERAAVLDNVNISQALTEDQIATIDAEIAELSKNHLSDLERLNQLHKTKDLSDEGHVELKKAAIKSYESRRYALQVEKNLPGQERLFFESGHTRRSGGRSVVTVNEVKLSENGVVSVVIGRESKEARRAFLDSSRTIWDPSEGDRKSFQYAYELPAESFNSRDSGD